MISTIRHISQKVFTAVRDGIRFGEAVAQGGAGLWYHDLDNGSVSISRRWCTILNISTNKCPKRFNDYLELVHPEDRSKLRSWHDNVGNRVGTATLEYRIACGENGYIWVTDAAALAPNSHKHRRVYGAIVNITKSKNNELDFCEILDTAPSLIFRKRRYVNDSTNPAYGGEKYCFKFEYGNRALVKAFHRLSISDVLGRTDADLIDDLDQVRHFYKTDLSVSENNQKVAISEEQLKTKNGTLRLATIKVPLPRKDKLNEPPDVLGIATDITGLTGRARLEERTLRQILAYIPDIIYVKNHHNQFELINKALEAFTSFKGIVEGKTTREIFSYDLTLAAEIDTEEAEIIKSGIPQHGIRREVKSSVGGHRISLTDKIPIPDENGHTQRLVVISRNLTQYEYQQKSFQQLLDRIPQCVFQKDRHLRFIYANQAFLERHNRITQGRMENLRYKTDKDLWPGHEPIVEGFQKDDLQVLEGRTISNRLEREPFPNGDRHIRTTKVPLYGEGQIVGLIGFYDDVERRNQEFIEQVILDIAHVLKNKIPVLESTLGKLKRQFGSQPGFPEAAELHLKAIDQFKRAVVSALLISSMDDMPINDVDLIGVIKSAIKDYQQNVGWERKIEFCSVKSNQSQLKAALIEMIYNAIKANSDNPALKVKFDVEVESDHVILHVTDNGVGIPEHLRATLFNMTSSGDANSTGFGLSHLKRLMRASYGDVWEISRQGEGAHFKLKFCKGKKQA